MDDNMKKLIEKYKQELMAAAGNSHANTASAPSPAPALDFPEMLPEEPAPSDPDSPTPDSAPAPGESAPVQDSAPGSTGRTPTVIAWSADSSAAEALGKYFSELPAESTPNSAPESTDLSQDLSKDFSQDFSQDLSPNDFSSLPPQFTDEAPQNDFTNDNVSPENNSITDETEQEQQPEFRREGENTASDPAQTAGLGTVPESGQSPEEQLGRRSFESQAGAVNSREDVKPLVQEENGNYPEPPLEPEYADLDDFLRANPRQGTLRFRTYTARNALPVEGARVLVTKVIGGSRHTFYDLLTDSSGQTQVLEMPAPSGELSQSPTVSVQPYALYDADITAEGYIPVSVRSLPVFEGILSVQRIALVPSAGTDEKETITESEPDLTEVPHA